MVIKSSNNLLASFISQLNIGCIRRLRYIKVDYSKISIKIVRLLYEEGIIRLFILKDNNIFIFFKYFKGLNVFKFKIVSKPSKRIYWSLRKLSLNYNKYNFSGFYVISTPNGFLTSNSCLLYSHVSGEVLFKVYI